MIRHANNRSLGTNHGGAVFAAELEHMRGRQAQPGHRSRHSGCIAGKGLASVGWAQHQCEPVTQRAAEPLQGGEHVGLRRVQQQRVPVAFLRVSSW